MSSQDVKKAVGYRETTGTIVKKNAWVKDSDFPTIVAYT